MSKIIIAEGNYTIRDFKEEQILDGTDYLRYCLRKNDNCVCAKSEQLSKQIPKKILFLFRCLNSNV